MIKTRGLIWQVVRKNGFVTSLFGEYIVANGVGWKGDTFLGCDIEVTKTASKFHYLVVNRDAFRLGQIGTGIGTTYIVVPPTKVETIAKLHGQNVVTIRQIGWMRETLFGGWIKVAQCIYYYCIATFQGIKDVFTLQLIAR